MAHSIQCPNCGNAVPLPSNPRAGEIFRTVLAWIPRDRSWSMAEAKNELPTIPPKQISNVFGYLVRKRQLRHLGYGRYLIEDSDPRVEHIR